MDFGAYHAEPDKKPVADLPKILPQTEIRSPIVSVMNQLFTLRKMNDRLPVLVLVTLLSGCTIIEQPPIVVTDGPSCGQGTVLRGNQCVAIEQGPTDAQIRQMIIDSSIRSYSGNCPCPYNSASNGSRCGGRSAYSRPGGASPICYDRDITDAQVAEYRRRLSR